MKKTPNQDSYTMQMILSALNPSCSFSDSSGINLQKTELYKDVAERLSNLAVPKRFKPWSWRYIQSIASGSVKPSQDMIKAMNRLGALLDGMPKQLEEAVPIILYGNPEEIKSGSLVLGKSRLCGNPACPVWFIPVVPNQMYHHPKCRMRNRK